MREYAYTNEIVELVKEVLEKNGLVYFFDEEHRIFEFVGKVKCQIHWLRYIISVEEGALVFYGLCPIVPDYQDEEMMAKMAEFTCRVNFGLLNGCFELDYRDGELRYKSFIDCEGGVPSAQCINNSIHCIAALYKRYADGIIEILFKDRSAKEAVESCEQAHEEKLQNMLARLQAGEMIDEELASMYTYFEEEIKTEGEPEPADADEADDGDAEEVENTEE